MFDKVLRLINQSKYNHAWHNFLALCSQQQRASSREPANEPHTNSFHHDHHQGTFGDSHLTLSNFTDASLIQFVQLSEMSINSIEVATPQ